MTAAFALAASSFDCAQDEALDRAFMLSEVEA
jgi:hypothetical protein